MIIGPTLVPAQNGVVMADYSYKLVNVSTSDAGEYAAEVKNPDGFQLIGPSVILTVMAKPSECVMCSVCVTYACAWNNTVCNAATQYCVQ